MSTESKTPIENTSQHPHGPEDPRWITEDGRCLICADDYHRERIRQLETELQQAQDDLADEHSRLVNLQQKLEYRDSELQQAREKLTTLEQVARGLDDANKSATRTL